MPDFFLIIVSALFYVAAFLYPSACGWLIVFSLGALFRYFFLPKKRLCFLQGFLWALFINSFLLIGILMMLLEREEKIIGLICYSTLIIYLSIYAGFFFKILGLYKNSFYNNTLYYLLASVIIVWVYTNVMDRYSLYIFGHLSGNFFYTILLPLMDYPSVIPIISFLRPLGASFLFIIFSALIAAWYGEPSWMYTFFIALLIMTVPLISFFHTQRKKIIPSYVSALYFFKSSETLNTKYDCIENIILQHSSCPHAALCTYSIGPESLIPFCLQEKERCLSFLSDNISAEHTLIVGGHRKEGKSIYNSVFVIKEGLIIDYYDKIKLMSFGEYIPYPWNKLPFLKRLFLKNNPEFSCGAPVQKSFYFLHNKFTIYLCCELLLHQQNSSANYPQGEGILCLANDSWFCSYVQNLLVLTAQYRAVQAKKPLVYSASSRAMVCDEYGQKL